MKGIEYVTDSWNPVAMRCNRVGVGCEHCWHLRMCPRLAAQAKDPRIRAAYLGTGPPVVREEVLM